MGLATSVLHSSSQSTRPGQIALLYGDADLTRLALFGVARVAAAGRTVWVLDGANSFDAYCVARLARAWNHAPEVILSRIRVSRAFTCYQMGALVTRKLPAAVGRSAPAAVFGVGLLETFYDEDVPMADAVRLLKAVLTRLSELARCGHTILITAREPGDELRERSVLFNLLKASVNRVEYIGVPSKETAPFLTQPRLMAP